MRVQRVIARPVLHSTVLASALFAACTGPTLTLENPDGHGLYLDGRRVADGSIPGEPRDPDESTDVEMKFRYYGTTRWDAIPQVASEDGVPRFDAIPTSRKVTVPVPASRWLFPFDFPVELIGRIWNGRQDQRVTVFADPPTGERIERQVSAAELARVRARALGARSSR